jgi:hypothetical protein
MHSDPSFADVFTGVELASWLSGHSVSLADAATIAIALEAALAPASPPAVGGQHGGVVPELPGLPPGAPQPDAGRATNPAPGALGLPGAASNARAVGVVTLSVATTEPRDVISRLADDLKLQPCRPSDAPTHIVGLADLERRERQGARTRYIWRRCYRLRPCWWASLVGAGASLEECRTCLVVTSIGERTRAHSSETVVFTTYSLPFLMQGRWSYPESQIARYRDVALRLAGRLRDAFPAR